MSLTNRFINRLTTPGEEPLEGYIELTESETKDDATIGVRIPKKLAERLNRAIKLDCTTKSKVMRSLIEFYIIESELNRKDSNNIMSEILEADDKTQLNYIMKLSTEERELFLELKEKYSTNLEKEKEINKNFN
jgi:metal-responsive CopG/Arc/MetJ family transcriptional regulator